MGCDNLINSKDVLEKVTPEIVIEILKENGSNLYKKTLDGKTNQTCLWFKTICHAGDSHKLCYFTQSKDFFCYTSCGKMPFFSFIMKIKNLKENEFYKAVLYVANKTGCNYNSIDRIGINNKQSFQAIQEDIREMENFVQKRKLKKHKKNFELKIYDENILNYFDPYTFYQGWVNDGISIKSMYKFNIRWYELEKHIIIPHYNYEGELVGIRRRSLKKEDIKNKYMPETIDGITYEHALGMNFYGIYENHEAIIKYKKAILVEGEKSVLLSDTYYGKNSIALATCGFNISDWQINILIKMGVEQIYLCFDKDYDIMQKDYYKKDKKEWIKFKNYCNRLKTLGERLSPYFDVYLILDKRNLLEIKDSPLDKGKQIFEQLLEDKKQSFLK